MPEGGGPGFCARHGTRSRREKGVAPPTMLPCAFPLLAWLEFACGNRARETHVLDMGVPRSTDPAFGSWRKSNPGVPCHRSTAPNSPVNCRPYKPLLDQFPGDALAMVDRGTMGWLLGLAAIHGLSPCRLHKSGCGGPGTEVFVALVLEGCTQVPIDRIGRQVDDNGMPSAPLQLPALKKPN